MYDWGDLRFFLTTARTGTALGAAQELGVNPTTVARRIAALESALSLRLFDRNRDGYRLSESGAALLNEARRIAAAAECFEGLAAQRSRELSGVIRMTMPESLANFIVTPLLAEFMELYPDIKVELIVTDNRLDIAGGEADIAIRGGLRPTASGVVLRKLGDDRWSLYCSSLYAAKRGAPATVRDLADHLIIGADGPMARITPFAWLSKSAPGAKVRSVCSSLANVLSAIKASHGVGPLPVAIGAVQSGLIECGLMPDFGRGYYLVIRQSLKDVPRVKAFSKFLAARAATLKRVLEGRK